MICKSSSDLSIQQPWNPSQELLICQIDTIGIRSAGGELPGAHFSAPWHISPPPWQKNKGKQIDPLLLQLSTHGTECYNRHTPALETWTNANTTKAINTACFVAVTCLKDAVAEGKHHHPTLLCSVRIAYSAQLMLAVPYAQEVKSSRHSLFPSRWCVLRGFLRQRNQFF